MTERRNLVRRGVRRGLGIGSALLAEARAAAGTELRRRALRRQTRKVADLAADDRPAIVLFAPESGIVSHFMAHALVAKSLQERGHRVLVVRCHDVYQRCVVMDSMSLPRDMTLEQRQSACAACAQSAAHAARDYGIEIVELAELVDDEVRHVVARQMRDLPEDLASFEIDGVKFAQFCGAEAAVTFKVLDPFSRDPEVRTLLLQYLEGALLSYHAMKRLAGIVKATRLVHFNEYSMLLGAAVAARGLSIPTTNMSFATVMVVDRQRIVLMPTLLAISSYREQLENWHAWRNLALSEKTVAEFGNDCRYRMTSNSAMIYSPVRTGSVDDLYEQLAISQSRRLLVAFTSSLDEVSANKYYLEAVGERPFPAEQPFRDQIEWLEALIARVEPSDDLQLVVRIHPREGANRRDKVASRHLAMLRERFTKQYEHVRFVWPGDAVSSYDLAELADVGLTGWSTIGLEMVRFGVPVVAAFNLHTPFPVGDVVRWQPTRNGYFQCLDEALRAEPDLNRPTFAYRWSSLRHLGYAVDLGDVVPDSGFSGLPPYRAPAAAEILEDAIVHGKSVLEVNHSVLRARQRPGAHRAERAALQQQFRRNVWFFCLGEDPGRDYRLFCHGGEIDHVPAGYDAALSVSGGIVTFLADERTVRRRSPMVRRMALLAAHNLLEPVHA
jgi:hypothetical protein